MARNNAIETTGIIIDTLGNDRFRIELDNGAEITAYPCGKIRVNHIHILPGDKVRVEMSPYDLTKGRITRRL